MTIRDIKIIIVDDKKGLNKLKRVAKRCAEIGKRIPK